MDVYRIQRLDNGMWIDDMVIKEQRTRSDAVALLRDLRAAQPNVKRRVLPLLVNDGAVATAGPTIND